MDLKLFPILIFSPPSIFNGNAGWNSGHTRIENFGVSLHICVARHRAISAKIFATILQTFYANPSTITYTKTRLGNAVSSNHVASKTKQAGSISKSPATCCALTKTYTLAVPAARTKTDLACAMTDGVMVNRSKDGFGPDTGNTRRPTSCNAVLPGNSDAI